MEDRAQDSPQYTLKWSQAQEDTDKRLGICDKVRTMELILWLGDRLVPGLKMTMDLPSMHPTGKCPMLDI